MHWILSRKFIRLHDGRWIPNFPLLHTNRSYFDSLVCTNTASIILDIKSPIDCACKYDDLRHNHKLDATQHDRQEIQPSSSKGIVVHSYPSRSNTRVWARWPNRIIDCTMCNSVFVLELFFQDGDNLEAILRSGIKVVLVERPES